MSKKDKICGTCKFRNKCPNSCGWNICNRINEFSKEATVDDSNFYTKPDFGCILWEKNNGN